MALPEDMSMAATLPRPSTLFLIANLALVGITLSNVFIVESYTDPGGSHGRDVTEGQRSVMRTTVYVEPGNVLRLPVPWSFNGPVKEHVTFYIVEGGQGTPPSDAHEGSDYLYGSESEFVDGRTPPVVYHIDQAPLEITEFEFRRPEPPAGKAHFEPEGWKPKIDEYESLDLVWVYDRSVVPASELGIANNGWNRARTNGIWGGFDFVGPAEISGFWLDAQPVLSGLAWLCVVAVVGAGIYWWSSSRRSFTPGAQTGPTEGMLRLADSAEGYLRHLRQLGLLNGVLLVLGGLFGITAANYFMAGPFWQYPTGSWNELVLVFLVIAYVGLILMWFVHYRRLAAEFRRVHAHLAQPPIIA